MKNFLTLGVFFSIKTISGALILVVSARWLPTGDFAAFSQFGFLIGLLNLFSAGGLQSAVIREAASAGQDWPRLGTVAGGALAVSAGGGLVLLVAAVFASAWISEILVAHTRDGGLVIACAAAALIAGLGQIGCAYLSGTGHLQRSIVAQSIAILIATLATVIALTVGSYQLAVAALSVGLAMSLPAMILVTPRAVRRDLPRHLRVNRNEVRRLVQFASAFLATAALMPTALFLLRDHYREVFGITLLAYWLAANRISDVTTQFIGLYMSQIYVPEVARAQPATGAIIARYRRHLAGAAAIMVIGFVVFALAPTFFVSLVVGPGMAAASGIVLLYLAGDVLRTWPSINANHLIAKRRVPLYVGLEVANVVFFAIGTLVLVRVSPLAPAIAYIGTNLIVGLIGLILVWRIERPRGIA